MSYDPDSVFSPDTKHGFAEWCLPGKHQVTVYTDGAFEMEVDDGRHLTTVTIPPELFEAMLRWREEHLHG